MKVLVVDDVGYIRHHVSRMLQSLGHIAVTAESARKAVQLLEKDPFIDVVLTDLLMAESDGLWLFNASRQIERMTDSGNANPPAFILMSALRPGVGVDRDVQKLQVAEQMGFAEVLSKPFDAKRLKEVLDSISQDAHPLKEATALLDQLTHITKAVRQVVELHNEDLNREAREILVETAEQLSNLDLLTSSARA